MPELNMVLSLLAGAVLGAVVGSRVGQWVRLRRTQAYRQARWEETLGRHERRKDA
jgi:hypothetical protein